MKFILTIDTGNDAFHEGSLSSNLAALIEKVAGNLRDYGVEDRESILDANGNRVGEYTYG